MHHRPQIPALALLGLTFTACSGDDGPPSPIVGEWGAVQVDGEKSPELYGYDDVTFVSGMKMTVERDLAGHLEYYGIVDYGDYEYHSEVGSDLVVDELGASQYRIELAHDFLTRNDDSYDSVGDGENYIGDGDALPVGGLAVPIRPDSAPAELVLTCTLDQDILNCETAEGTPSSLIFKRKAPQSDDSG